MSYETLYIGGVIGLVSGVILWLLNLVKEIKIENKKENYIDKNGYIRKSDLKEFEFAIINRMNEIGIQHSKDLEHAKNIARSAVSKMNQIEEDVERLRFREEKR